MEYCKQIKSLKTNYKLKHTWCSITIFKEYKENISDLIYCTSETMVIVFIILYDK